MTTEEKGVFSKDSVIVFVEQANDGTYWGTSQNIPGVVSAFGNSLEELKANFNQAFLDYLEVARELGEPWLRDVEGLGNYLFKLNLQSFFRLVPEVKISAIAEKAGINASLLRQYATGKANASETRAKQIEKAVHQLGQELLSVSL
ncbi:type II toxin-antitoxin system HicB family antitoxin [Sediminicola luteus]|uniref:HicB family protein n=1 Tax=Sediminicola luteus TaxID=319238 RepID=A0A2A4G6M9_9FLAO|nr:type II toxin-antitoxin system HicB family antitoxin [Sediminicola luteus]PCE63405.1 hypothetical protein B7P33_14405 [Sediminicola luteus]